MGNLHAIITIKYRKAATQHKNAKVKDAEEVEYQLRPLSPNTDVGFHKIYISQFSKALDGVMNQKMKLVLWLIRKMTLTNELKYSYREIAGLSGISYQTVAETMKALIEDDFIRRNGKTLMVNPNAVFRGRLNKKTMACNFYNKLKQPPKKRKRGTGKEAEAPEKTGQKEAPEKRTKKEPKKEPLSLKDRNDLEWEVTELSKEVSRLRDWKYNLESQFLLYKKEDENGELKKIGVEIEKLSNRVKYLSGLLLSAELPEEKDKKNGEAQTKEPET